MRSWFVLGNESFTSVFCVNIDEPALMCHGQCQMDSWEADWQEEQSSPLANTSKDNELRSVYPETNLYADGQALLLVQQPRQLALQPDHFPGRFYHPSIFHPPKSGVLS